MKVVLALLLPSTLIAALCVLGGLLVLPRRTRRVGATLLAAATTALALVFLLPVDQWLLRPLEELFPRSPVPSQVDGVVVLGGAVSARLSADRGATLNRDADRLLAFAALAHGHPQARLVFAGGPPALAAGVMTEAEASRSVLDSLGVAPGRVLWDDQSRTTAENATFSLSLAKPQPGETWLLVTSASHMPRAMGAFEAAGWPPLVPWPVAYRTTRGGWPPPLQPVSTRLSAIDLAAHEWAGLLAYRFRRLGLIPG